MADAVLVDIGKPLEHGQRMNCDVGRLLRIRLLLLDHVLVMFRKIAQVQARLAESGLVGNDDELGSPILATARAVLVSERVSKVVEGAAQVVEHVAEVQTPAKGIRGRYILCDEVE